MTSLGVTEFYNFISEFVSLFIDKVDCVDLFYCASHVGVNSVLAL